MAWVTPPVFVAGAILTAAQMNVIRDDFVELAPFSAAWTAFTPQLRTASTNYTSTVIYGRYLKIGKLVYVQAAVTATASGGANEIVRLGLPAGLSPVNNSADSVIGGFKIKDAGTAFYVGMASTPDPGWVSGTAQDTNDYMGGSGPRFTMAPNDTIAYNVTYEIA